MKTDGQRRLRILAHMDVGLRPSREMTRGILRYAATHPDVEVRLFGPGTAGPGICAFRDWRPDGLIVGRQPEKVLADAARIGCRAAVLSSIDPPEACPFPTASVFPDNAAVAAGAAEHFAACGIGHLAFVGERRSGRNAVEESWSAERDAALRECAARQGLTYASFGAARAAPDAGPAQHRALTKWIASLPKPCGILAARDLLAGNVLEACRAAGVAVPEAALVLGVDDDEFICPHVTPTLSSIVIDLEGGGYLEAEALVALLRGETPPGRRLFFGVRGVARRQSTSDSHEARLMVSRARAFIREHAASGGIGVRDVARAAFASVRLLEKNFKTVTGGTVCQALQDARLARVRALLTETRTPIGEIAGLCGFESDGYLKELFRRRFGCSMRVWRNENRVSPDD